MPQHPPVGTHEPKAAGSGVQRPRVLAVERSPCIDPLPRSPGRSTAKTAQDGACRHQRPQGHGCWRTGDPGVAENFRLTIKLKMGVLRCDHDRSDAPEGNTTIGPSRRHAMVGPHLGLMSQQRGDGKENGGKHGGWRADGLIQGAAGDAQSSRMAAKSPCLLDCPA
jgi:hypothetical protein